MPRTLGSVSLLSVSGSEVAMSRLIYGILRQRATSRLELPAGPEGSPISLIAAHGIAAASAPIGHCPSTADLPAVLAFARVVRLIHSQCAILPARFGSCFASEAELKEMMACRAAPFRVGLDAVEGCEEMSLKAELGTNGIAIEQARDESQSRAGPEAAAASSRLAGSVRSGKEYMTRLRARHD
jgi:Gas vesicle synthesis protein GvpL/GvpF